MDRVKISANLMIISDLDYTMVDHNDPENISLLRFNALWEAYYRQNSLLVFSTGRSPTLYTHLRKENPLLTPDITVTSVGTEIAYGESMIPDNDWEQILNYKWDRNIVVEETSKFPELSPQSETEQRPHKVSFYVEKVNAFKVVKALTECLERRGLDIKIIYSNGMALDILPLGAGKGQALSYLLKKFEVYGKQPTSTLVCGDSGNDAELFSIPEVYGVMVSNAQEELLQWHQENAKNNSNIVHATQRCAAGIMEAIGNFGLGPNISPRDITDFPNWKVELFNPSLEVVKVYLLYERWRCAAVKKTEQFIQNLKSSFHPLGIFVHPSGFEQPLHKCFDAMEKFYGDQQGKCFKVWLDLVFSSQLGSNTRLMKFYKWECFGQERQGFVSTVLLSTKEEEPHGFMWLHVHQTSLDNGVKNQTTWFF